jgi:hypothetical protein
VRRGFSKLARALLLSGGMLAFAAPAAHASLSWDETAHDFGSHNVGAAAPSKTFTLTAVCDSPAVDPPSSCLTSLHFFGTPSVTGDGFSLTAPNTCASGNLMTFTFPGSATCTSTVAFTPASAGPKTGTLVLPDGPDVALSGAGVAIPDPGVPGKGKKCKKRKKRSAAAAKKKKCKKRKK